MKSVNINENCIGCGFCFSECPEIFKQNDEGLAEAKVNKIPEDKEETATEIAQRCPVDAIEIKEA